MSNTLTYFPLTGNWETVDIGHAVVDVPPPPDPGLSYINALVDFTPRLPLGKTFHVPDFQIELPRNEIQSIAFNGTITGGTYKLGFNSVLTSSIAYTATASQVQTALQGLSSIGAGNVAVAGTNPMLVTFQGALANTNVATMAKDDSALVNGTINIGLPQAGSAGRVADTDIHLDPFTARITNGQLVTPASPNDVPGLHLVSNTDILGFMDDTVSPPVKGKLYYDIRFYSITPTRVLALKNFAILAPEDTTAVNLTDPDLIRFPFAPLSAV